MNCDLRLLSLVSGCLALMLLAGCEQKKVVKIGPGPAGAPAPAAPAAQVLPPPKATQPRADAGAQEKTARKRKRPERGPAAELGEGEQLFALLDPSGPAGAAFEIDGIDADAN